jgi:hypothetical protein
LAKVHVLQVDRKPENIAELEAGVSAGRTVSDWQMPKDSRPGDLVIWYAAGRQEYVALGWVDDIPVMVKEGPGPYRGKVGRMESIKPVDRRKVIGDCGLDGGVESYQTVDEGVVADFLDSLGLAPDPTTAPRETVPDLSPGHAADWDLRQLRLRTRLSRARQGLAATQPAVPAITCRR